MKQSSQLTIACLFTCSGIWSSFLVCLKSFLSMIQFLFALLSYILSAMSSNNYDERPVKHVAFLSLLIASADEQSSLCIFFIYIKKVFFSGKHHTERCWHYMLSFICSFHNMVSELQCFCVHLRTQNKYWTFPTAITQQVSTWASMPISGNLSKLSV